MDSRIIYTANRAEFWKALETKTPAFGGRRHGDRTRMAIEVGEARLYVEEIRSCTNVPSEVRDRFSSGWCTFLVDIHHPGDADRFLAAVLTGMQAVIDDDQGKVMSAEEFAQANRVG